MTWLQRFTGEQANQAQSRHDPQAIAEQMSPGLDSGYDAELREKAGLREPPVPPEYMGLDGEYDPDGLAKRVALAFDRDPAIAEIETLNIVQEGSTIHLQGVIPNQETLDHMVEVARQVDGSKAIETNQVQVEA